jgi:predicted SprT family Zn-dependent metalloprotease
MTDVASYDAIADATPTTATYGDLNRAYGFFNERLFGNRLPHCLITLQRYKRARGYFCGERFASKQGEVVDEIALNPEHMARDPRDVFSTLVHEMVHLEQKHFGKEPKGAYHNKQWGTFMKAVGLHPSDTGEPGGKETGRFVSHYIIAGGPYDVAFAEFEEQGFTDLFFDHVRESDAAQAKRKKKNASKTKFACETCEMQAWAKPTASLWCGECQAPMVAEEVNDEEGDD